MNLHDILHKVGDLISNPALDGGTNLAPGRAVKILHWLGTAMALGDEAKDELEQLKADIAALHENHGNEPEKGFWDKMVERYSQLKVIVKDVEAVGKAVKKGKGKPADPPKDTSPDAPKLDPQP
jgi:hypothetical protein